MRVLIVCNNAFTRGNGLYTALQSLLGNLRSEGLDVRLLAAENEDVYGPQPDYPLKHFRFPVFENLIESNGFRFAAIDTEMLDKAVMWADIIHVQEAFPLESKVIGIAEMQGKPCVATYHLFAQNVVANAIHGNSDNPVNHVLDWWWKEYVFNRCSFIHCPTETVRRHLESQGYDAGLEVFSNGIALGSLPHAEKRDLQGDGTVRLLCIGRLSYEKSQSTLLEAMRYSRHSDRIQLVFAGKGPMEEDYRKMAAGLVNEGVLSHMPTFGFYDKESLNRLIHSSYLYIHCAWAEVEGLSCLESIKEGLVPVIAEGPLTATSQFALDGRSVFPAQDARTLAEKIDWWIEHPDEHDVMSLAYAASAEKYDIRKSTSAMIGMYRKALAAS